MTSYPFDKLAATDSTPDSAPLRSLLMCDSDLSLFIVDGITIGAVRLFWSLSSISIRALASSDVEVPDSFALVVVTKTSFLYSASVYPDKLPILRPASRD